MEMLSLEKELKENSYPGRGIVIGRSADGKKAVTAYFIMGRSENSRNRVFVEDGEGIRTQAFDPSKLTDPSLIIYAPVRVLGNKTIVTNGDQTDTIYEGMDHQLTFEQSLRSREFEPDGPNYTPRISGVPNAIRVFEEMREEGIPLTKYGIRIDSGDLAYLSKEAYKMLAAAGFDDAVISASSDLDEYLIESLKAQQDLFYQFPS